jgi:hypothetical protein
MERLLKSLLSHKGQNSYRSVLLALCLYVAWKVTDLDRRVAVIEARLNVPRLAASDPAAPSPPRGVTGPEWPKHVADALRQEK